MIFNENFRNRAVKLEPFKVKWNDETEATHLLVNLNQDDLYSCAMFSYSLLDDNEKYLYNGIINVEGEDYTTWDGNNEYPYEYVAEKLELTFTTE